MIVKVKDAQLMINSLSDQYVGKIAVDRKTKAKFDIKVFRGDDMHNYEDVEIRCVLLPHDLSTDNNRYFSGLSWNDIVANYDILDK
jgi:hypothetical protein